MAAATVPPTITTTPATDAAETLDQPAVTLPRTLGRYAVRYGTTTLALAAASIAVGASSAAADDAYEVRSGDTVSDIALRTGSSAQAIRAANSLDSQYRIRAGQQLVIPTGSAPAPAAQSAPATATHVVAPGDTVSGLAARYGATTAQIVSSNGLGTDALIRIGQTLAVPTGGGRTATPTASASPTPSEPLVGSTFAGRTYASDVVSAANQNKATLLASDVPSKEEVKAIVRETARAHGVDPSLALAVAMQESGFDQRAVSPANAIGAMQVIPSSGGWASDLTGQDLNLLDTRDNVTAGVAILARLIQTSPTLDTAIAGYYQGQTSVRNNGMFDDTRRYVANVQTLASQQG